MSNSRIGLAMNSVTNFLKVALNCLIKKIIPKIGVKVFAALPDPLIGLHQISTDVVNL